MLIFLTFKHFQQTMAELFRKWAFWLMIQWPNKLCQIVFDFVLQAILFIHFIDTISITSEILGMVSGRFPYIQYFWWLQVLRAGTALGRSSGCVDKKMPTRKQLIVCNTKVWSTKVKLCAEISRSKMFKALHPFDGYLHLLFFYFGRAKELYVSVKQN